VWCWSAYKIASPTQVSGLSDIVQLSNATCGLKSDGSIWRWDLAMPATPPTDISDSITFRQGAHGHEQDGGICAVSTSNKVYCRTANKWVLKATAAATEVSVDRQTPYRAYARGTDGSIWSWAPGATPTQDSPSGYAQLEAAEDSVVLRTTAGGVLYNGNSVATGELNTTFTQVTAGLRGLRARRRRQRRLLGLRTLWTTRQRRDRQRRNGSVRRRQLQSEHRVAWATLELRVEDRWYGLG
jgi:hypothetical protein